MNNRGARLDTSVSKLPSSIGDIIGNAVRICRVRVPFLISILIGPTLFEIAGQLCMMVSTKMGSDALHNSDLMKMLPSLLATVFGFALACSADVFLTVRHLSFMRVMLGYSSTYKKGLESVRKRFWHIVGIGTFYYMAFFVLVVFWVCVSAMTLSSYEVLGWPITLSCGLLVVVGALISVYAVFTSYPLVLAVIGCEDLPFTATLSRAHDLASSNTPRAVAFITMIAFTYVILYLVLTSPIQGMYVFEYVRQSMESGKLDQEAPTPLYLEVINCMYFSIINMLIVPICTISSGLFYRDIRMRTEGADLVEQVKQLAPVEGVGADA